MSYFRAYNASPINQPRLSIHVSDARRFVRNSPDRSAVIVADLFHPARDGAGSLYTIEHFTHIRDRLSAGGMFCQWLPLYQLDVESLAIITQTMREVFPHLRAYLAYFNIETPAMLLVGSAEPVG